MQNPLLLKFVAVFIASTILKVVFNMLIGGSIAMGLGVVVDVVFLACVYVLLRQYRVPSFKRIMTILLLLTFVSTLVELGVIGGDIGNLALLAIFGWLLIGKDGLLRRGRRF